MAFSKLATAAFGPFGLKNAKPTEKGHFSGHLGRFTLLLLVLLHIVPHATHAWLFEGDSVQIPAEEFPMEIHGGGQYSGTATEDSRGNIYISNEDAVLCFDGINWTKLPAINPGASGIAIEFAPDERIWVGGTHSLGHYERGESGTPVFQDHTPQLREALDEDEFGLIWDIFSNETTQYIITNFHVVIREGDQWSAHYFNASRRILPTWLNNELYIHARGDGVYKFTGTVPQKLFDEYEELQSGIIDILAEDSDGLMLATIKDGIWAKHKEVLQKTHESSDSSDFSLAHILNADGSILIGKPSGLYLQNTRGQTVQINEGQITNASRLFQANDGSIWITGQGSIYRLPPIDRIEYPAKSATLASNQGNIYVTSDMGIAQFENGELKTIHQGWTSTKTLNRSDFQVYTEGLQMHAHQGNMPFAEAKLNRVVSQLFENSWNENTFYVSDEPEISRWRIDQNGFKLLSQTKDSKRIFSSIADVGERTSLYTTYQREVGLIHWPADETNPIPAEIEVLSTEPEFKADLTYALAWPFMKNALLATNKGIYSFDSEERRFERINVIVGNLGKNRGDLAYSEIDGDTDGLIIYSKDETSLSGYKMGILRYDTNQFSWEPIQLAGLVDVGQVRDLLHELKKGREILWISGSKGLFRYDITDQKRPKKLTTNLRSIQETVERRVIFGGYGEILASTSLSFPQKLLRFDFSTPSSQINPIGHETRLVGFAEDWSDTDGLYFREFSNLPAGRYRFEVRAIDEFGRHGPASAFEFTILPPWYLTPAAIAIYSIGGLLVIYIIIRLWTLHLRKRNLELERLINQRTSDLEHTNQELRKANSVKQDFLASMSHEIRNPLNGIIGIANLLEKDGTSSQRIGYLNACARHLHQLLGQVLDYSAIESGKVEIKHTSFDALALCRDALDMHQILADEKDLKLIADFTPVKWEWMGDPTLLKQIVVNLINNAIKYTPAGKVCLRLEAQESEDQVDAIFTVEDTGPGVPVDQQQFIFDNFTRLDRHKRSQIGGTGLGLAIASELAAKMGGGLAIDHEYTSGARFILKLTFARTNTPAGRQNKNQFGTMRKQLTGKRILVADDMEFNRYITREFFESLDAAVVEAEDGEEALISLQQEFFDIAVLDINMPRLNGTEVARKFLRNNKHQETKTTLIALSAHTGQQVEQQVNQAGFDAFIEKPLDSEKLLSALPSFDPSKATSKTKGMDLLSYLGQGDSKKSADLTKRFNDSFEQTMSSLEAQVRANDPESAREALHKLKGLINLRRSTRTTEILESLSKALSSSDEIASSLRLCTQLKEEVLGPDIS